jgi:hypothetical protein
MRGRFLNTTIFLSTTEILKMSPAQASYKTGDVDAGYDCL